ncbi:hypothetical protein BDW62DRAFT_26052 [Aspergillus aurantiobrunneus]
MPVVCIVSLCFFFPSIPLAWPAKEGQNPNNFARFNMASRLHMIQKLYMLRPGSLRRCAPPAFPTWITAFYLSTSWLNFIFPALHLPMRSSSRNWDNQSEYATIPKPSLAGDPLRSGDVALVLQGW